MPSSGRSAGAQREREFSRFVGALYGLSTLAEIGNLLATATDRLIGHDSLVFCELSQSTGHSTYHTHTIGPRLEEYAGIINRQVHEVPFIQYYQKRPGGAAVRTFDIVSKGEWERTTLYNEGLAPLGIHEQLGAQVMASPGIMRGFMLNRGRRSFHDRDVPFFDLLIGHVAAAAATADQWRRMDRSAPGSDGRATVMLGGCGRVLFRSPEAAALLESLTGPFRQALPEVVIRWVEREIATLVSGELWKQPRQPLVLEKAGRVLTLRLVSPEAGNHHVLLMERHTRKTGPGSWHLSTREKEVLRWMAWGKTNPEIAEILGVSVHTVKNHVKRILSALRVENRTAAVSLLMEAGADRL